MTHSLETSRCLLRPPVVGDFAAYRDFFADAGASAFYGGPMREDRAWRVLAQNIGHWQMLDYGVWSVVERETGHVLGGCGFWWPEGWPRRELTWWLVPAGRGRGIATEVSRAAIRHAYRIYGWDLVETHIEDDNLAARRLIERLGGEVIAREGFPDGVERDVYRLPEPDATAVRQGIADG